MTAFSQNFLTQLSTDKQVWLWVKERLTDQKSKSFDEDGHCVYKSDTGLKCAVGHLIEPIFYDEEIEGHAIYSHEVQNIIKKSVPNWQMNEMLLNKLQCIHDSMSPFHWEEAFDELWFDENDNYIHTTSGFAQYQLTKWNMEKKVASSATL